MKLSNLIISKNLQESEVSKEFASFILRYHDAVDYGDFSEDPLVIQKLRRYENIKYAAEIEMLNQTTAN